MDEPGGVRLRPAGASAGDFPPGEAEGRRAHARGAQLHRREQAQRSCSPAARRGRHRSCRAASTTRCSAACSTARPGRRVRRQRDAAAGAQRHVSAGAGADQRLLRRQARRAGGRGRPARVHRAGDRDAAAPARHARRRCTARTCCPWPASTPSRCWRAACRSSLAQLPARTSTTAAVRAGWTAIASAAQTAAALLAAAAGAAAELLHRLPGAAGVLGAEAGAAGHRPVHIAADIGCHAFATFEPFSHGPLDPRLRHEPGQPRRRRRR